MASPVSGMGFRQVCAAEQEPSESFEINPVAPSLRKHKPDVRCRSSVQYSAGILALFGCFSAVIWRRSARILYSEHSGVDEPELGHPHHEQGQGGHGMVKCTTKDGESSQTCKKQHVDFDLYNREKQFYEFAATDPAFREIVAVEGFEFDDSAMMITMENLDFRMVNPMRADLKLGKQTFDESARTIKRVKMMTADALNLNALTGIRIAGMNTPGQKPTNTTVGKVWDNFRLQSRLTEYLYTYALANEYSRDLRKIVNVFKNPIGWKFVGMSVFSVYDDDETAAEMGCGVKLSLIDFAQTKRINPEEVDQNVLDGLEHLQKLVQEIEEEFPNPRRLEQVQVESVCKPGRSNWPLTAGVLAAVIFVGSVFGFVFVHRRRNHEVPEDSIVPEFIPGNLGKTIVSEEKECNW